MPKVSAATRKLSDSDTARKHSTCLISTCKVCHHGHQE